MPYSRFILPLFLCVLLPLAHAQSPVPAPTHALFDGEIRRIVGEAGVPGAAYAIVVDGHIETARGFGVREIGGRDPVTADTVFRTASLSKTFAAQLTAMLVDEGRLQWTLALPSFAPDFRLKGGAERRLQLQHLLGQSTGLVPNAFDNLVDAGQPLEKILPHFRTLEPSCAPGQCYGYQNIVYGLSALAIEQASAQDYGSLLTQRVFVPLGMRRASVGMAALLAEADSAKPHIERDGRWQRVEVEANYYQLPAAAGVNASAKDLATWLIAQMGGFPATIAPAQVALLTKPRVVTPKDMRRRDWKDLLSSAHYGLGWRIYRIGDEPIILHAGWVKGYVAEISYSPRLRTGLVVLMNGESGSALNEIGSQFWRRELEAFPAPALAKKPPQADGIGAKASQSKPATGKANRTAKPASSGKPKSSPKR